jgi:predicted dehydrogenase
VRYVEARVTTLRFDIDVDDTALLTFEHANGKLSSVHASWCARAPALRGRWITISGTEGAVRIVYGAAAPLSWACDGAGGWEDLAPSDVPGVESPIPGDSTGHAAFFVAAVQALESGAPPPVTGAHARHNLAIIDAARRASAARRAVEVEA